MHLPSDKAAKLSSSAKHFCTIFAPFLMKQSTQVYEYTYVYIFVYTGIGRQETELLSSQIFFKILQEFS